MSRVPRVGTDFAGYRIEGLLGRGGMGAVYRAENPRLGASVALKVLAPELAEDEVFRERFVRESRLAASINHPNIVTIFDAGEFEGALYIAMRLVEGSDLKRLLRRDHRLDPERALGMVAQLASALDVAHGRGLVHRDVKPGNVLVETDVGPSGDFVYLSDFGLTKHLASTSGLTATGAFVGTIDYMAPEQIEGDEVGPRADQYSLGCLLFECLVGRPPFQKGTDAAVLWAHMREDPPRVSRIRSDVPSTFDGVVGRALAKAPDDRFASCGELVDAARTALGGDTAPRRRSSPAPAVREPRRSRPLPGWVRSIALPLAVALLAAAAGVALGMLLADQTEGAAVGTTSTVTTSKKTPLTLSEKVLLDYVPAKFRKTCEHARLLTPDFTASLACNPIPTMAARYNLARNGTVLREHFRRRARGEGLIGTTATASRSCDGSSEALVAWKPAGSLGHAEVASRRGVAGQALCYARKGWAGIEWTDERVEVYAIAYASSLAPLYRWWRRGSGPRAPTPIPTAKPPEFAPPLAPPPPPPNFVG